jgi:REP element-mobilizing transposase RayT
MHWFKTMTTTRYADGVRRMGWARFEGQLWLRNYYDRVVRSDRALTSIKQHIHDNTLGWQASLSPDDEIREMEHFS